MCRPVRCIGRPVQGHVSIYDNYVLPMCRPEDSTHETKATSFNTSAYVLTYRLHESTYNQESFSIGRPIVLCVDL